MHVFIHHLNSALLVAAIFSMAALLSTASLAGAQTVTGPVWQAPIDKAWDYGGSWYWDSNTNRIGGSITSDIIVESVEDGVIKGRIASPSGTTLSMYGNDSRVIVTYWYDSGISSPQYSVIPEKGEFSVEIPPEFIDADYVKIFVNSHSFDILPGGAYPKSSSVSTTKDGPTNKTSTTTFVTDGGLEGTVDTLVTEESTTTKKVTASEESVVTATTIIRLVEEKTTVTTPKPAGQINTTNETTTESSTTANSSLSTSTSTDKRITTTTNVTSTVSSKTETTSKTDSVVKVTTVNTNSTEITTETISLAFKTGPLTVWDKNTHFKIVGYDSYYIMQGTFKEFTYYQAHIPVAVSGAMEEYRLK